MMTPRLEMRGIRKTFGPTIALGRVDLQVLPGEVHALVGENGAGKSTLMKVLSGAYLPDAGEMFLDGQPYHPRNPLDARAKGVGMIYQELSLAPHLTVEENIVLGMEPGGFFVDRKEMRRRALDALTQFNHPDIRPESIAGALSVSAQQLVEIGRSLAMGCRVLVFDEPTSSLAQKDIERLFNIIDKLRDQGISIIYISHFLEEVERLAARLTVLRDGSAVGTLAVAGFSHNEVVKMMVGRDVKDLYPRSERQRGEVLLEVKNLAGEKKPRNASIMLHRGEVVGICGLVGSGRTEFFRALFGLDKLKSGQIALAVLSADDLPAELAREGAHESECVFVGHASPRHRWQQGVGFLSENRKEEGLALDLSIADNVTITSLDRLGCCGFFSPRKQNERTQRWIETLGIKCQSASQAIGGLSGGNQQKGALARLLEHDVDIFLLDEPTRGIDIAAKARIYQVIDELVTRQPQPKAVLMISSYLPELFGVCDRIAVMSRGVLTAAKPVKEIDEHKIMLVATGKEESL